MSYAASRSRAVLAAALRVGLGAVLCLGFAASVRPARADQPLDQHCTVAVANRTAQVRPDGTWNLYNVPANLGPVRVRATCVRNGLTESGQSDFVTITQDELSGVPSFGIGVVDPIPRSLTIAVPATTLTSIGATAQITLTGTYPDNSTRDLTAGPGTAYGTSNAATATVTQQGLVTAVASGTVLVSATNDGALGVILMRVVLSGDSDGDGIPDDLEIANGLNPNDPVDAIEDFDRDDLTNAQEILTYGTDIRRADTDGDGIRDDEEVVAGADGFVTNPLLADTDGDGVRDLLEVQTGTDPTNAASFNLAAVLVSISATPADSILTYNTILSEAYRQLSVTGLMTDGYTLNLTSGRGTNYASSNLAICNFGAIEGAVYAGQNGICDITASNSGFSSVARVRVRTFSPIARSSLSMPGAANNVDVAGDYAYVAAGASGLVVVNVSNRLQPSIVGSLDTPGNANDVRVLGGVAYVADGSGGLRIVNVANPASPAPLGNVAIPGTSYDLAVAGGWAYVAAGPNGLKVVDVSNSASPSIVGSLLLPGSAKGVDVVGTLAVVASPDGLHTVDVSNPAAPALLGSVTPPGADTRDVALRNATAVLADYQNGPTTVDVSNPATPSVLASVSPPPGGRLTDVAVVSDLAFGADQVYANAVPIVSVADPAFPIFRAAIDFSQNNDDNGLGIAADGRYVYMTGTAEGVEDAATASRSTLHIGQYLDIEDGNGVAPLVSVTSPAPNAQFYEGSSLPISVSATDDVLVASVDFIVDGQTVGTTSNQPYLHTHSLPLGAGSKTISARAFDLASNVGTAAPISVTVITDPPPSVVLTSPAEGASLIEASTVILRATATDNFPLDGVTFRVDGQIVAVDPDEPYQTSYHVPLGITTRTIEASATDSLGRTTTSEREVPVIPDPLTTVIGVVRDPDLVPVAGATVTTIGNHTSTSGPDGSFSIPGVPTAQGALRVEASKTILDATYVGASAFTEPVPGGTTDVGTIVIRAFPRARRVFTTPPRPNSIAAADLDADGKVDLAVTNEFENTVFVRLAQGGGDFDDPVGIAVGDRPMHVTVGRVDAGLVLDLVVTNFQSDTVSVLYGNGDGTFQPAQDLETGDRPRTTALGDFDGDGKTDLAVAEDGARKVSVYLANGDGTFHLGSANDIGPYVNTNPGFVAAADFNLDNNLDLAATPTDGEVVSILIGNGDGTFEPHVDYEIEGLEPVQVVTADVDGDGKPDVAVVDEDEDQVTVFHGVGDGTFTLAQTVTFEDGRARSLALADLSGDGHPDLVVGISGFPSSSLAVALNDGGGVFGEPSHFEADDPRAIAVADVNGDGRLDVATADFFTETLSLSFGDGNGALEAAPVHDMGDGPTCLAAVDINDDDNVDLVGALPYYFEVAVRLGNGDGSFGAMATYAVGPFPFMLSAGPLNADSFVDVVTANRPFSGSASISRLLGNGDGTFQPELRLDLNFCGSDGNYVFIADLNSDTTNDLIQEGYCTALGQGNGSFQAGVHSGVTARDPAARGDFDEDGFTDLVAVYRLGSEVQFKHGNGDGTFGGGQAFPVGFEPRWAEAADFNDDGNLDVVTADLSSDAVSILLGNGNGTFAAAQPFPCARQPFRVFVGDVNGDGSPDVVATSEAQSYVAVLLGDSTGGLLPARLYGTAGVVSWVALADVNADGLIDILTTNESSDNVSILYGRGNGRF